MKNLFLKTKSVLLIAAALLSANLAFAETGSETEKNATGGGSSNAQVDGQSYYVAGTYIAGTGSAQTGNMTSKGFKLRTGTDGKRAVFTVQEGYTITSLELTGASNYELNDGGTTEVHVIKVEVDGTEVAFTGGEAFKYRGGGESCTLNVDDIEATQSIAIYFDNGDSKGSQINASWAITWQRPDATQPTITVSPTAVSLVPGATFKLAARVDPSSFTTAWASDNEAVATVAADGTVTAVAAGVANISNAWDQDATVAGTSVVTVAEFNAEALTTVKTFDFKAMESATLTIESTAAGNIWNEANNKANAVYFLTNEGLEDIAVQAVESGNKGWKLVGGEGLVLASGAGRCAAIGHLTAGQIVEIIYTGTEFYTGSHSDAQRKDSGAEKTALNQGVGRAIYQMTEDGLLGFEITKGKAIEKIVVYEQGAAAPTSVDIAVAATLEADGGYVTTFSSPYALDFSAVEGITAYVAKKYFDSYGDVVVGVKLTPVDQVPAGEGVLIKADEAKTYTIPVAEGEVAAVANDLAVAAENIDLFDAIEEKWGSFVTGPLVLGTGEYYDLNSYGSMKTGTAFFPLSKPAAAGTDFLEAGTAYLPFTADDGDWGWGAQAVELKFADGAVAEFDQISELLALEEGTELKLNLGTYPKVTFATSSLFVAEDAGTGIFVKAANDFKAGDILTGSITGVFSNQLGATIDNADISGVSAPYNFGNEAEEVDGLAEAFSDYVQKLVKLTNVTVHVEGTGYSASYTLEDEDGTEVALQPTVFGDVTGEMVLALQDGDVLTSLEGYAVILPETSMYVQFGYPAYFFEPTALTVAVPQGTVVNSIAEFIAIGEGNEATLSLTDAQVNFASENLVFIQDETAGIALVNTGLSVQQGQRVSGTVTGKFTTAENYYPQLVATDATNADDLTVANGLLDVKEVSIAEAKLDENILRLVQISDAYYAADLLSLYGGIVEFAGIEKDDEQLLIYDVLYGAAVYTDELGDEADGITIAGLPYQPGTSFTQWGAENHALMPVKIEAVTTSLKDVKTLLQNGAFYNLNGVRVDNPQKGIYIQNGKKVVVK